jgi:hypothetical protein
VLEFGQHSCLLDQLFIHTEGDVFHTGTRVSSSGTLRARIHLVASWWPTMLPQKTPHGRSATLLLWNGIQALSSGTTSIPP